MFKKNLHKELIKVMSIKQLNIKRTNELPAKRVTYGIREKQSHIKQL